MPVSRLSSWLFRLAAAAVLAGTIAVPAQARPIFENFYPGGWGRVMALPVDYAFPRTIAFPGHVYGNRLSVAGGLQGALGRLHLP
jgi:hypothetical protein